MGNQELNLVEPISKKIYKSYEDEDIRVGICLMQGWRKTMEDTTLTIPNFDGKNNSLFGVFDGHGGSIISQFVACNIDKVLKNSNYYQKSKSNNEKALVESFILMDELLKNKEVDTFLKKILLNQKALNEINGESPAGIINRELSPNIKNDPNNDYLFFVSSHWDNEANLKYQFPDLDNIIKKPNGIEKNINENEDEENFVEKKEDKSPEVNTQKDEENYKSNTDKNIKYPNLNKLDQEKKEKTKRENNHIVNSKTFFKRRFFEFNEKNEPDLISNNIGTTANILLLKKNYFYIANVGDSLSVMYKNRNAIKLNKEHKTTYDKELNRINKIGGKLINYRINGKLNITRALGDLSYKNRNNGYIYEQDVLPIPEVKKYSLVDVDFIVMGTDGFWDYGDDIKTICDNIYSELKKDPKRDLCALIGNFFDKGLAKANNYLRGTDNMSCIIIQFLKKK